jgi:alpha-L-fucosidase 2
VLFGAPAEHRIAFAHEEFFLVRNSRRPAPRLADDLGSLRGAFLGADPGLGARLVDESLTRQQWPSALNWTDPLGPAGTITWKPTGAETTGDYLRSASYLTGEVECSWREGVGRRSIRLLPLREQDAVLIHLSSDVDWAGRVAVQSTGGEDSVPAGVTTRSWSDRALALHAVTTDEPNALTSVLVLTTLAGTEIPSAEGALDLVISGGDVLGLVAAIGVSSDGVVAATADALQKIDRVRAVPPSDLSQTQERSHGELTGASSLTLTVDADVLPHTSEELIAAAKEGSPAARRGMIEATFAAGRHVIASSTGTLPPTLQGVWQGSWSPAWSSDYTMNGNLQNGAVASMIATGTPDLLRSVFRLLDRFRDDYVDNAKQLFGARGWLLPSRATTHGHANHFTPDYPHEFWIGNGAWMLRLAADLYSATGDEGFLRETAWPLATNVLRFYGDALTGAPGETRHVVPSYSPENTPANQSTPLAVDATSEIAMIRDALRLGIRIGRLVGETTREPEWLQLLQDLPGYRVSPDGLLAEWLGGTEVDHIGHRHASHLYPLWYEDDAAFEPAHRAAAKRVIDEKIAWRAEAPFAAPGHMEMAFGLVQLGFAAAHLSDAVSALRCVEWLAVDHWRANMVSTHDAGEIFNVDAAGGLPALVAEMLLQSSDDEVRLLPALPDAWPSGRITGLRARGGIAVDELQWDSGHAAATIRLAVAGQSRPVRVIVPSSWVSDAGSEVVVGSRPIVLRLARRDPMREV